MKIRRGLSVFFLFLLLLSLTLSPTALAAEEELEIHIAAKAALLVDPTTNELLYEQNAHERLYPASLTKVMTALLILEAVERGELQMDQMVVASESALAPIPFDASVAGIKAGDALTVENLLNCILVVSGADACNILAEAAAGSISAFVDQMNERAEALGCENTHFVNTTGLHDDDHYSTAYDLYRITMAAMACEKFMPICDTRSFTLPATAQSPQRTYHTTNYLLSPYRASGYVYQYAHGVKTGFHSKAGNCLISTAEKDGRTLLGVVMGAEQVQTETGGKRVESFTEMVRLFKWGFDHFKRQTILSAREPIYELTVALSERDFVVLHPAYDVVRLLPTDVDVDNLERTFYFPSEVVDAPISEGDELGEVTLSSGDTVYATVPLLALTNVDASRLLVFRRDAMEFLHRRDVRIGAAAVILGAAALSILMRAIGKRKRYGKKNHYTQSTAYRGRKRR